jgi:glucose-1-phosphate thymidylyltransferase
MKALVLAGGLGSRLRPLTQTGAKQLLPVANQPIIHYVLNDIRAAGIKEVGVLVGTESNVGIRRNLQDGSNWDLKIDYLYQEEPLGLAHCVIVAEEYLGDEPFVMYLGDNLLEGGINPFASAFKNGTQNATIVLTEVDNPTEFGVAEFDQAGQLKRLVEKPSAPPSNWALTGIYFFDQHIIEAVHSIKPSGRNELEITDAIQWLMDQGYEVGHEKLTGWWKDAGTPEDLLESNLLILQDLESSIDDSAVIDAESQLMGQVKVGAGVEIRRSIIRGPVIIGDYSRIEDSFVGASTALGARSLVKDSEVSCSIVMEGAVLQDVPAPIDWSLIGRDAIVNRTFEKPKALNLILGDMSRMSIL